MQSVDRISEERRRAVRRPGKEADGKWVCGVYKQPSKYLANPPATDAILRVMLDKEFLHIGEGCGMPDNVKLVRIGEPGEPIAWVSIQEREEALG